MLDYGVTSELFRLLVAQGEIKPTVGAEDLGMKSAGGSYGSAGPQVLTDARGGKLAPVYELRGGAVRSPILIWNNPNMPKATGRNTSRVVLEIVGA